jgi:hypothetical protein
LESAEKTRLHIYNTDLAENPSLYFDTGMDQRSFARTKMSQSLIEPGYIVFPDGSHKVWKAAGVDEVAGNMRVWGAAFTGKRLDLLINEADSEEKQIQALKAVTFWIRAKMLLGDKNSSLNPGAAFVCMEEKCNYPKGSVFFAPEYLSNRCLLMEGTEIDRFNCPDLTGMNAAAFCAGTMLYKILSKSFPYSKDETIFQDMREGAFFPPHLAAPGLNIKICSLIQSAFLLPVKKSGINENGTDIISKILNCLTLNENNNISVSSLYDKLSTEEYKKLEKEKKNYLLKQNTFIKIKLFIMNNKRAVMGAAAGLLLLTIIIGNTIKSYNNRPSTAGMDSDTVIEAYFEAYSSLDHVIMEACVQGADKSDINAAVTLFAVQKTREAYERSNSNLLIPAKAWKEAGGELPAPNVFGVTDLSVRYLSGSNEKNIIIYRAEYFLWYPDADYAVNRSDTITLKRDKRNNWRITEILREEKTN